MTCFQVITTTPTRHNDSGRSSVGSNRMNQRNGAGPLLNVPPRSGNTIMNPVGNEAPRRARRETSRPRRHYVGRRPSHPPPTSESQRPDACLLAALAQDYANRIDECETKRRRAEAEVDREIQHRNAETKRRQAEWQRREALFKKRIQAAFLDVIWSTYSQRHPDANHTHDLAFLGWAHSSGAYPHGTKALEEDWQNAVAGRPVTQRRTPNQSRPQGGQQRQRQTYNRTNTRPSGQGRANTTNEKQQSSPRAGASTRANAKASASNSQSASPAPQTTAAEDRKAPLSTRNWVVIGILAGAVIIAAAAVLVGG